MLCSAVPCERPRSGTSRKARGSGAREIPQRRVLKCKLRLGACESAAPVRSTASDDANDQDAITVAKFVELKNYAEAAAGSEDPTAIAVKSLILFDSTIYITGTAIIGSQRDEGDAERQRRDPAV